ncbi:MAG: transcription factor S [Candidatus Woesearchaeota archaeon]
MRFCPKCGSLMFPQTAAGETYLVCRSCGHKMAAGAADVILRKAGKQERELEVVEKELEIGSAIEARCPKCGNMQAYAWEVQTRAADEPATRFYKCTRCKHVWREYK